MVKFPIWKDTFYTYSGASNPILFDITDRNGAIIYSGKAYQKPGESDIKIQVNTILENFVSNDIPSDFGTGSTRSYNGLTQFGLWVNDAQVETYLVLCDHSYDSWTGQSGTTTTPINGHLATGQYAIYSEIRNDSTLWNSIIPYGDYSGTLYSKGHQGSYALYYQQANGAWASFLIEGLVTRRDSLTKYEMTKSYNNTTNQFGRKVYHTDIEASWTLNTGWLTEEQADNLCDNLLCSSNMYLHILCSSEIVPVVMDENEVEFKTHKGLGNKLISYEFRVNESQKRYRL